jgi:hypothetical protein
VLSTRAASSVLDEIAALSGSRSASCLDAVDTDNVSATRR